MLDADMKDWLQRLSEIPGGWMFRRRVIRHAELKDRIGNKACPLVAMMQHEKGEKVANHSVMYLRSSSGLDHNVAGEVINAADDKAAMPEIREALLEACGLEELCPIE